MQGSFGKHNVEGMVLAEIRDYKENSFSGYNKNMSFSELPELALDNRQTLQSRDTVMQTVVLVMFFV